MYSWQTVISLSTQFGWHVPGSFHHYAPALSYFRQHSNNPLTVHCFSPGSHFAVSAEYIKVAVRFVRSVIATPSGKSNGNYCICRIIVFLHRLSDAALFLHSFAGVFHPRPWQVPMPILLVYPRSDPIGRFLLFSSLSAQWVTVWSFTSSFLLNLQRGMTDVFVKVQK